MSDYLVRKLRKEKIILVIEGISILIGFCMVLAFIVIGFTGCHMSSGKGGHVGIITAAETTGFVVKTKKVYFKTSQRSSQEDEYCVIDKDLYKKLKTVASGQDNVEIFYTSYWSNGFFNCDGEDAVVTSVKVLNKNEEKK